MLNIFKQPSKVTLREQEELFSATDVAEKRRAEAWLDDRIARSQSGVFSEVALLTPALAEMLKAINPDNRNIRQTVVDRYVADIREGNWKLTGESVKVSKEGLLNDGQHRCTAVIRAGRSITTIFTFGLDRQSRLVVDQGAVRTTGDYLGMAGVADGNHVAAVATLIWQYERFGLVSHNSHFRPTKTQIQEVAVCNPGIVASIRAVPAKYSLLASKSILAFCHFEFAKSDKEAANAFLEKLVKGTGLDENDPIYLARSRLLSERKTSLGDRVELLFRAWNLHRRGVRSRTKLQLTRDKLPEIAR